MGGFRWTFPMTLSGADWPTGTPPEQWDALPSASKWQIITFVALLELFDESSKPHYTRGRRPGEFPTFKGTYIQERGLTPLDLFDPSNSPKMLHQREKRGACALRSTMAGSPCSLSSPSCLPPRHRAPYHC